MAEAPKRPSRSKKAPAPDFSPFEDWLIDGPAGAWPKPWEKSKDLTDAQKQIVAANAALLLDRDAWFDKVQAFETALAALTDEAGQKAKRSEYSIRFDRHRFLDGPKRFSDYTFPCSVSFDGASFGEGYVSFSGASFGEGDVWFDGASFGKGYVSFNGASFGKGDVSFSWASFGEGDVSFFRASFGEGHVSFSRASFGKGDVSFSWASFGKGNVWLREANFGEGDVWFNRISFRSTTMPASGMVVAGNLYVRSHFPEAVDFSRLEVKGTASFSGSSFAKVPDFRDAKFDRPPEVAGMQVPRPRLGHGGERVRLSLPSRALFSNALDPGDVAKFRKLKAMALAANDHERDGEFFVGEMLAKRGVETTSFFGLAFNTLYHVLSDFGQSYTRPLMWMLASHLGFAAIYLRIIGYQDAPWQKLAFAASLSARNTIPLLGSLFRFAPEPDGHEAAFQRAYDGLALPQGSVDWLIRLGVTQSILSGVLLFLFLLALRNKFRLK